MHLKRIFLIISLITALAFITAWMQMQIVRQGYNISMMNKFKEQVINDHKKLELQFTSLKSPQHLLVTQVTQNIPPGRDANNNLIMPEVLTLSEFNRRVADLFTVSGANLCKGGSALPITSGRAGPGGSSTSGNPVPACPPEAGVPSGRAYKQKY